MKKLTEKEILLLNEAAGGLITKEELQQQLPYKFTFNEIENYLDEFLEKNDYENFEAVFLNIPHVLTKEEDCKLYRKYLLLNGHYQHENIVTAFQTYFNEDKENIGVLLNAISSIPEYLQDEDMKYPYIRKILYAISAQPKPECLDALKQLTNSEDIIIKELALKQITKLEK